MNDIGKTVMASELTFIILIWLSGVAIGYAFHDLCRRRATKQTGEANE